MHNSSRVIKMMINCGYVEQMKIQFHFISIFVLLLLLFLSLSLENKQTYFHSIDLYICCLQLIQIIRVSMTQNVPLAWEDLQAPLPSRWSNSVSWTICRIGKQKACWRKRTKLLKGSSYTRKVSHKIVVSQKKITKSEFISKCWQI